MRSFRVAFQLPFVGVILAAAVLQACMGPRPPEATPTQTNLVPSTARPSATAPRPDATAHPAPIGPTVASSVDAGVAYLKTSEGSTSLFVGDPLRTDLDQYLLGVDVDVPSLEQALSSDGSRFAYCSGSEWKEIDPMSTALAGLTLNILDLHNPDNPVAIPLLPPTYPGNFTSAAETYLGDPSPDDERDFTVDDLAAIFLREFSAHQCTLSWSPDGRFLAFSGIISGSSSDLYLYDTSDGKMERISSELGEIHSIHWSPDGEWIAYLVDLTIRTKLYIVAPSGEVRLEVPAAGALPLEWISQTQYLFSGGDGFGAWFLSLADTRTRKAVTLWPNQWFDYAYNPESSMFILYYPSVLGLEGTVEPGAPTPGLYSIDPESTAATRFSDFLADGGLRYWGSAVFSYVAASYYDGLVGITESGEEKQLAPWLPRLSVSPDSMYLAAFDWTGGPHRKAGLDIFSADGQRIVTITPLGVLWVMWSPDSKHLLYLVSGSGTLSDLYYSGIQPGTGRLIATGVDSRERAEQVQATWLQPR